MKESIEQSFDSSTIHHFIASVYNRTVSRGMYSVPEGFIIVAQLEWLGILQECWHWRSGDQVCASKFWADPSCVGVQCHESAGANFTKASLISNE